MARRKYGITGGGRERVLEYWGVKQKRFPFVKAVLLACMLITLAIVVVAATFFLIEVF